MDNRTEEGRKQAQAGDRDTSMFQAAARPMTAKEVLAARIRDIRLSADELQALYDALPEKLDAYSDNLIRNAFLRVIPRN